MNKNILKISMACILLFGCSEEKHEIAEVIHARKPTPYYTVKTGDSVESVSVSHGMTSQELIETNGLITPYELIPGQKIIVRLKTQSSKPQGNAFESDGISVQAQNEPKLVQFDPNGFTKTTTPENAKTVGDKTSAFNEDGSEASTKAVDETPAVPSGNYSWPVKGKVIRKFGEKTGSEVSEGISIAAPEGTPVYPAAPGTILKSNEEIKGFGKAIVIQHEDGKKSLYLHLKVCNAKVGQKVDAKTIIGRVGKSGGIKKPQLHFQLRDANKKAINPLTILGS